MSERPIKEGTEAKYVDCHPDLSDPGVVERRHRAGCLLKLTPRCPTCPNSKFTLLFNLPEKRLEQIKCPRWDKVSNLHKGQAPDSYVITEEATCSERPFPFCGSCPSRAILKKLEIDKGKDGWHSRWVRFTREGREADDE